jgi:DNA polymerase I-like protein with 3'-5' exonuclease and polymerase domains
MGFTLSHAECAARYVEQAGEVKTWLERAMVEGMDAVMNGADEIYVPVEVEVRMGRNWGEEG